MERRDRALSIIQTAENNPFAFMAEKGYLPIVYELSRRGLANNDLPLAQNIGDKWGKPIQELLTGISACPEILGLAVKPFIDEYGRVLHINPIVSESRELGDPETASDQVWKKAFLGLLSESLKSGEMPSISSAVVYYGIENFDELVHLITNHNPNPVPNPDSDPLFPLWDSWAGSLQTNRFIKFVD